MTIEKIKECINIPTVEVKQDIIDTQTEIDEYEAEIETLKLNPQKNRTDIYMREGKISNRQDFIKELESIMEYREELQNAQSKK